MRCEMMTVNEGKNLIDDMLRLFCVPAIPTSGVQSDAGVAPSCERKGGRQVEKDFVGKGQFLVGFRISPPMKGGRQVP